MAYTTLFSNPLHLNQTTNHSSIHFSPTLSVKPNQNLRYSKNLKLSSNRHHATTPSASSSSGVESLVLDEDTTSSLDSIKVFDLNGKEVPISDLWKDRKAVVAFARHFGCVLCRKRADYLASKKDIMDASGVALVLIGPGNIEQARTFAKQMKFEGEIYADPNHSSYEALKFVSGVLTTFTPKAGLKIIQLYMEGYRQDWKLSFEKDTVTRGGWKQGGIIVAGPGKNNISYVHKDREAGDDPEIEDILAACCS
ncbi:thioredoxin-like protein AAED1, chloroplastic isoform X1 [Arachis duranensis]|uniref:Thioredoxin-like protein AAED1, chloroplastic isoform X1 n=1 Tax=Arachis duranensis TaxID=130453 RepID=A0A6P4DRT3_ARADU|nr:thioredoxin-like protein AAED1, chloroplastic isoform X1 [Arachis duranensis]